MNMDQFLTPRGVEVRQAVSKVMSENYEELNRHYTEAKFPFFMLEKIYATGASGLTVS